MGAVFELPIVILLLSALGSRDAAVPVEVPAARDRRRRTSRRRSSRPATWSYTSVILTVPLYLLYELSIGLSWIVFRKRERKRLAKKRRRRRPPREDARAAPGAAGGARRAPDSASAQLPTRPRPRAGAVPTPSRTRADSLARRDSIAKDSTGAPELQGAARLRDAAADAAQGLQHHAVSGRDHHVRCA